MLTEQAPNKLTEQLNTQISVIVKAIGTEQHSLKTLMEKMELKHSYKRFPPLSKCHYSTR